MKNFLAITRRSVIACIALVLAACAGYGGTDLKPGVSTLPEVIASMGQPAMRWKEGNGREQLAYPRGPSGTQSFMVFLAADGRLERIEQVLDVQHFARIEAGKSDKEAVLRIVGPSLLPPMYFKARNELAWEWRFRDSLNQPMFFGVLFDATTGLVRTTYQRLEPRGEDGGM